MGEEEFPKPEDQQGWGPDSGKPHSEVPAFPDGTFEGEGGVVADEAEVSIEPGAEHADEVEHGESDSRWDKQKAETLAPTVQEIFESDLARIGNEQAFLRKEAVKPAELQDRHRQLLAEGGIKANQEYMDRNFVEYVSPIEELYDSNPSKFAGMTASEFMEVARKFTDLSWDKTRAEGYLERLGWNQEKLQASIEKEHPYDGRHAESFAQLAGSILQEERESIKAAFEAVYEDKYNKTPRQINEALATFYADTLDKARQKLASLEQERQSMLGKTAAAETP